MSLTLPLLNERCTSPLRAPCLRNDVYCVEWDVKLYYTVPEKQNKHNTVSSRETKFGMVTELGRGGFLGRPGPSTQRSVTLSAKYFLHVTDASTVWNRASEFVNTTDHGAGKPYALARTRVTSDDFEWNLKVVPAPLTRDSVCVANLLVWRWHCIFNWTLDWSDLTN